MRKLIKYSVALLTALSVALWVTVAYSSYKIPNEIYVTDLNNIRTNLNLPISHTVVTEGDVRQVYTDPNSTENYDVKFNLFGVTVAHTASTRKITYNTNACEYDNTYHNE